MRYHHGCLIFTALVVGARGFQPLAPLRSGLASTQLFAGGRKQPQRLKIETPKMNNEIESENIRVIASIAGGKDEPLGVMNLADALAKAKEMGGLDLILVNEKADPPVCKIADYSKYRYMQEKKAKEVKKNSKSTEIKEVKMSYKIDVHDYEVRKKNALKFLKQGNRVKATVMFRGREVQHDKLGFELLDKLALELEELCVREGRAKREGRNLSLILGPRAEVLKAVNEDRKSQEKAKKMKKKEALEAKKASQTESASTVVSSTGSDLDAASLLDDDDDDDDDSLDQLLGGDKITDDLFSTTN